MKHLKFYTEFIFSVIRILLVPNVRDSRENKNVFQGIFLEMLQVAIHPRRRERKPSRGYAAGTERRITSHDPLLS